MWDKERQRVEVDGITPDGLLASAGKPIPDPKPIVDPKFHGSPVVQEFAFGDRHVFLNESGDRIDISAGQGGTSGVLLTQSRSPVYYLISVNDVYAYFLTATKGSPPPTYFPTSQVELDKVVAFAAHRGTTLSNPNALCVEVKTSWVEADQLPDTGSGYITMTATVPSYDRSDPMQKIWRANGSKSVLLALVGMHIAGSAKGHTEMIWATFEHFGNTPHDTYEYNSIQGPNPTTVRQDTSGSLVVLPYRRDR